MLELTGEIAVVTGGAAGMGRAIDRHLDEAGAQVVVVDRDPDTAGILAQHALTSVYSVIADVAEPHAHTDIIGRAGEPFGTPTILVTDAGVHPWVAFAFLDTTPEFFDVVYESNLRGLALTSIAFNKALIAAGRDGPILNIASADGQTPSRVSWPAPFAAAKGGVIALTRHMAVELAHHGLAVNAIAPGTVPTGGAIKGLGSSDAEQAVARAALEPHMAGNPIKRVAEPDDIAKAALFLVSSAADYIGVRRSSSTAAGRSTDVSTPGNR